MTLLEIFLTISVLFLLVKTSVLFRNRIDFVGLESCTYVKDVYQPTVALCIPARNEELNLSFCLESALSQDYSHLKVYVLNDRSTDGTEEIIEQIVGRYGNKCISLKGKERPKDWLGKPWACQQLSEATTEDILIFADADTWLEKGAVSKLVGAFLEESQDFITVWPQQKVDTFWEKLIVPLVYYALLGFLPVKYTERKPRWMPLFFHQRFKTLFAAACGQFVAFKREAYLSIGGHSSVKGEVVEDVWLARKILLKGFRMRMFHGVNTIHCRMYRSHLDIWNGFRKNFFAGFDNNVFLFLVMAALHLNAYILPVVILSASPFITLSGVSLFMSSVAILSILGHRIMLAKWMKWPIHYSLTHPLAVIWFQILAFRVLIDHYLKKSVTWKGERIN